MAETGVVERFFHDKGYGWITPDTPGWSPVFFHKNQCKGAEHLTQGDRVKFDRTRFADMTDIVENVTKMTMTDIVEDVTECCHSDVAVLVAILVAVLRTGSVQAVSY